ncbi:hypothetical protein [Pseudoalteromonas denitrificans]|nr:hypothetical protein [Pseudoalteromonas denitrificans]
MNISVHKFGGSSLGCKASFLRVINIIDENCLMGDWVVVSAAGKTTNRLLEIANLAVSEKHFAYEKLEALQTFQLSLIPSLTQEKTAELRQSINQDIALLSSYISKASLENLFIPEWLCFGELWSSRLLAALLNEKSQRAIAIDARNILRMQGEKVDLICSAQQLDNSGALENTLIKIATGFIASDSDNITQILGRNGSDYSASLFAYLSNAKKVVFWTDVSGVYSADPNIVKNAIAFDKLNWNVANILAQSGNPVLHANTVETLNDSDCEIQIKNSHFPKARGTKVVKHAPIYTPLVSKGSGFGLLCASWEHEVDTNQVAFKFTTNVGKNILIKNEYLAQYDKHKYNFKPVDLILSFGCERKFNDLLSSLDINVFHIHSFDEHYRFLITEDKVTDELYEVFHDVMCLESNASYIDLEHA